MLIIHIQHMSDNVHPLKGMIFAIKEATKGKYIENQIRVTIFFF